jgi:hypothetical protein
MDRTKLVLIGMVAALAFSNAGAESDVATNSFMRENLRNIDDEVASYRPMLMAMAKEGKHSAASREALQRIDSLMAESRRLTLEAKLAEAVRQGEKAKRLAIETMVKLKSGETVVHSLKFDTPAEEYAYELRRFDSNEMLVAMNLRDGNVAAEVQQAVLRQLEEAKRLKQSAAGDASAGRHADAVKQMETAAGVLTKALQSLGVPVF